MAVRPIPGTNSYFLAGVAMSMNNVLWEDRYNDVVRHANLLGPVHNEIKYGDHTRSAHMATAGPPSGAGGSIVEEFKSIWGPEYNASTINQLSRSHPRRTSKKESYRAYARRLKSIHNNLTQSQSTLSAHLMPVIR